MKTFRVEFEEVTCYSGTMQGESEKDVEDAIAKANVQSLKNVEPIMGKTLVTFIKEDDD